MHGADGAEVARGLWQARCVACSTRPAGTSSILFVTAPVGPLGSGLGGGVETNLVNLTPRLADRGIRCAIVAPVGSVIDDHRVTVFEADGAVPVYATTADRTIGVTQDPHGVLERMWDIARAHQHDFDVIIALSYDWLSYYLTPFFTTPVGHIVSLSSQIDTVDAELSRQLERSPTRFAGVTCAQVATFGALAAEVMMPMFGGVDLDRCAAPSFETPERRLAWVARVSREKGLRDAFEVCERTGYALEVCGLVQEPDLLAECRAAFPTVDVTVHGFVTQRQVSEVLSLAAALLMTHSWVEAFGNSAIEALAVGTPVISYARGGPTEIVDDGITGYLVEPGSVDAMADAVTRIGGLDRRACRRIVEERFTLHQLADRWLTFADQVASS